MSHHLCVVDGPRRRRLVSQLLTAIVTVLVISYVGGLFAAALYWLSYHLPEGSISHDFDKLWLTTSILTAVIYLAFVHPWDEE